MLIPVKVYFKFSDGSIAFLSKLFDYSKATHWRWNNNQPWQSIITFPKNGFLESK